jgi:hypothetical protein
MPGSRIKRRTAPKSYTVSQFARGGGKRTTIIVGSPEDLARKAKIKANKKKATNKIKSIIKSMRDNY